MPTPLHLVGVWNPSYAADAMQVHTALLLEWMRRYHDGKAREDDVYVWWGLVRSAHRQQSLPHLDRIVALDQELADESRELQFYLTDYRSLYVAEVGSVTREDVRKTEPDHLPAYYQKLDVVPDCWFALHDIRRLVSEDTLSVIHELRRLRNTGYHDQPVSLYGGMVDLPLLVTRPDGRRYFDEPGFDFGGVLGLLAKARETEVNDRLHAGLHHADPSARFSNLGDGKSSDYA
jgi:hypothetical protein